jgi:carboxymethylenebutenolidase
LGEDKVKKQLTDLQQYLVDEFVEDYQHGQMSRRDAFKRIVAVTGSASFASALLAACGATPTPTATAVPPTATKPPAPTNTAMPPTPMPPTATKAPMPPTATAVPPTATSMPVAQASPTRAVVTTTATVTVQPLPTIAPGIRVPENDPAIEAAMVSFPSGATTVVAYLARPKGAGPFPGVLVCHENRGLVEHAKDVTRRLGKAGFAALGVDLMSAQGGTDKVTDPAQIPGVLGNTPPETFVAWFQAGLAYLQGLAYVQKANIGMVGFCFGGGMTWRVATKTPSLKAAVPYYGPNPPLEDVPGIQAAVLAIYGGNDTRINAGIPAIEDAMKKANKTFEKIIYDGANHAFNNDTGANYKADAAVDAWAKMLAWFAKYLK